MKKIVTLTVGFASKLAPTGQFSGVEHVLISPRLTLVNGYNYCVKPPSEGVMRTIELSEAKHCLPQLCESVVQTGDLVVILADQEPLVTLAPASKRKEVKPSVWEARMRFEQEQGALTEEFDIPSPSVDESTWRNPLDA